MNMASVIPQGSHVDDMDGHGEFKLTDRDFRFIAKRIAEHAGIVLSDAKRDLVYGRLMRRLRALKLTRFSQYCDLLAQDDGTEMEYFVNALTTNLTAFFREPHHFDYMQQELLPALIRQKSSRTLRIWSAGCSTGEEPYSIAMAVAEVMPEGWDIRILATDLDSSVVATGRQGIYPETRVQGMSQARLKRWFYRGKGARAGMVKVVPELADMVAFKQLNLLSDWPLKGSFDIIFCRNVVIYFDKATQSVLFDRYANQLQQRGHLFIGHSETLYKVCDRFSLLGNTIYQRVN
ncbi:CheR family methyltransferase [Porticoccus sp.]